MPTAAKLFGAFAFALVAFFTAEVLKPTFPPGYAFGYFSLVCGALGMLAGWRVMGPDAGNGSLRAASSGVKTSFVMTMWALAIFSIREMVLLSMQHGRYDGVFAAIRSTFQIMIDFALQLLGSVPAVAVLVIGGMLGGLFANWAAARWN